MICNTQAQTLISSSKHIKHTLPHRTRCTIHVSHPTPHIAAHTLTKHTHTQYLFHYHFRSYNLSSLLFISISMLSYVPVCFHHFLLVIVDFCLSVVWLRVIFGCVCVSVCVCVSSAPIMSAHVAARFPSLLLQGSVAAGTLWWMQRELFEADARLPTSKMKFNHSKPFYYDPLS